MTPDHRDDARAAVITVVMPTFEQMAFLPRALDSLRAQTLEAWRLVIVDDGSQDGTPELLEGLSEDPRVELVRLPENRGVGAALNAGLERVRTPLVAYLPSDDVYHRDHLASLVELLGAEADAVLAFGGVRHSYNRSSLGPPPDGWLQLVQVAHRLSDDRWVERSELVSDDLERLFWARLRERGGFVGTNRVTCEWVAHPDQGHKVIRDPIGGINPYRRRYRVKEPLRFHSSTGNRIDEVAQYARFRDRPDTPSGRDGLRILVVGELSYNPERILALEERGHRLYGLWTDDPAWYTTVGPMPFGHVEDVPRPGWQSAVREIEPDVVYALLNWHTVPFAAEVRRELGDLPFVWHFKEGPFICLERGTWPDLVELTEQCDGVIHSSEEMAQWFDTVIPPRDPSTTLVLDGDLPKRDWFEGVGRTRRLSEADGEIHTVVPGRPIGLHVSTVAELAGEGIHLHFYGDFTHGQWREWIERAERIAPQHLHLHGTVDQDRWVEEFSRYDAGWLHIFRSENGGDIRAANWDDLNLPARMATLAAAGLPMIQLDNSDAIVATQNLTRRLAAGLFFRDIPDLGARLRDRTAMERLREAVWAQRAEFTFDTHADRLIAFFRRIIDARGQLRAAADVGESVDGPVLIGGR
jgi:glycosyltransferase involved in cell wall biosynthesis